MSNEPARAAIDVALTQIAVSAETIATSMIATVRCQEAMLEVLTEIRNQQ